MIGALVNVGKGDRNAAAALTHALKDKDWNVAIEATKALSKFDPEAAAQEGASIAGLVRRLRGLRQNGPRPVFLMSPAAEPVFLMSPAAELLTSLKKGNSNVIAAVTEALNDENRSTRDAATNALLRIEPAAALEAGTPVARLVSQAYDDLDFRTAVAGALAHGDTRVIAAYTAALNGTELSIRYVAGLFLAEIHPQTAAKWRLQC